MPRPLVIETERAADVAVLRLSGHLGLDGRRALMTACDACLDDPGVRSLCLDLHRIETADATALGLLLVVRERSLLRHKPVSLTGHASLAGERLPADEIGRHFCVV